MARFREKDDGVSNELTERITALTLNTKYNLTSLQYAPQHFGNVVIELNGNDFIVRFIYDRGDIYRDKKVIGSERWIDERLVYSHSVPCNGIYDLLLKAIEEFTTID